MTTALTQVTDKVSQTQKPKSRLRNRIVAALTNTGEMKPRTLKPVINLERQAPLDLEKIAMALEEHEANPIRASDDSHVSDSQVSDSHVSDSMSCAAIKKRPGRPQAALHFVTKLPGARVVNPDLIAEVRRGPHLRVGSFCSGSSHDEVADETRDTSLLRSCLRGSRTHRANRVNKTVCFAGQNGAECTHIFLYEQIDVPLPQMAPKPGGPPDRSGAYLKRKMKAAATTQYVPVRLC